MKTNDPTIRGVSRNPAAFRNRVLAKLSAYNESRIGPTGWKAINLEARNEKGGFVGGLTGSTYLGWLYVDLLFVEEKYRGLGLGKRLLRHAETWAKKRAAATLI